MAKRNNDNELIERFLKQELSEKEQALLEEKLQDEAFAEDAANEVVKAYGRAKLKNKLQSFDDNLSRTRFRAMKRVKRYLAVAASVVLLALSVGYWLMDKSPANEGVFAYFEPYTEDEFRSGGGENWRKAMDYYYQKKYPEAMTLFESLADSPSQKNYLAHFYLAQCHLVQNNPEKAIFSLNKVGDNTNYKLKATWYLALAHSKLGNLQKAESLFKEVASEEDFKSKEAKEILEKYF